MNELTGKLVNVVLAVEDGKGMEYIKNPITLIANFNGRILETDPASPEECPIFNTELVWEIEKKDLRKIRSSNVPLRVECFTTDMNSRKIKIGFILLSLRSAYIVPKQNAKQEVPFKWQRLNGVSHDIRSRHPELYLSLSIRDCLPENSTKTDDSSPFLADEVFELAKESDETIPLKYLEDGFIQVGEGELEPYYLNVIVKVAANLDVLLPENLVFNATKDKYHLCFSLFGVTIKSKPLKDLHNTIELNEKIVVSLLSSYETLEEFFSKYHKIQVCFHNGADKLGITKINVEELLNENSNSSEEVCYFHLPEDKTQIPESLNGRRPFIEVKTFLEQREAPPSAGEAKRVKTITSSLLKLTVDATGDAKASTDSILKSCPSPRQIYIPMLELNGDDDEESLLDLKKFCLKLIVENISWKKQLKIREFQLQFWHPRADTTLCFRRELPNDQEQIVEGVECRLYFVSNERRVKGLLYAWRPKLVLLNGRGGIISEVIKAESEAFALKETQEHSQIALVKNAEDKEILCEITIVMHLEQSEEFSEITRNVLYPPILDERIVLMELKQLKETKEKILEIYENDLETRTKLHIEKLEEEWKKKKEEAEEKLNKNVKKCRLLTKQLKFAAKNLELRQKQQNTNEEITNIYNKYSNHQYIDLIEQISKLQLENKQLKKLMEDQRQEIETNKKSALTKEQTANLLQELRVLEEQFEEAQKQKSYFKEQWKKAVKEIHELRTEEQKQLLSEIEQNKQELSQLSLECETFCESDVEE